MNAQNLTKRYRGKSEPALDSCSLAVWPGELIAVVGHNGAGKSTLFDALCGLTALDGGSAILGVSTAEIGWCPQREIIDWSLTVRQNIGLGLDMRKRIPKRERRRSVDDLGAALGLQPFMDKTAETLSGGELRRTQIARAMAGDPALMILDEPTTGLDPAGIRVVFEYLGRRREA
ncbi:ATP-binding cassette domain-containing protein, partial [Nocardia gipuzkoensis]